MHLFLKLTNLIANNCIKLLLLTSEQNLCEMALVKNTARNGAVCYHHDSKEFFVLLCLFLPQGPTLYSSRNRFRKGTARPFGKYVLKTSGSLSRSITLWRKKIAESGHCVILHPLKSLLTYKKRTFVTISKNIFFFIFNTSYSNNL